MTRENIELLLVETRIKAVGKDADAVDHDVSSAVAELLLPLRERFKTSFDVSRLNAERSAEFLKHDSDYQRRLGDARGTRQLGWILVAAGVAGLAGADGLRVASSSKYDSIRRGGFSSSGDLTSAKDSADLLRVFS